jgi:hypothetical protein
MAWYSFWNTTKENPAQPSIALSEGSLIESREIVNNYRVQYENLEVVNRAVNMLKFRLLLAINCLALFLGQDLQQKTDLLFQCFGRSKFTAY